MSCLRASLLSRRAILLSILATAAMGEPVKAIEAASLDGCAAPAFDIPVTAVFKKTAARMKSMSLRILAIGSSSTQGIGASSPSFSYPARLELALAQRFPEQQILVVNAGVAGETADVTLARLDRELDRNKPDLVLWQVGTNDAMRVSVSEAEFEGAVKRGAALIEQCGCDVIIVDQQLFKTAKDPERYERFVGILEKVAREKHLNLFSRYRIMKFWDARRGGVEPMMATDGFHLNDRGYACVADLLANYIQKIVSVSR
jgi:acyl-CoA thioesterase I